MSTEEQVSAATERGWLPKEQFRGDPEKWVDADVFLERTETFVPFLRKERERLQTEIAARDSQIAELSNAVKAANAAIDALQEAHEADTLEQVKQAREQLKGELAEASREGDHDRVAEITEKMTELGAAEREAKSREDEGDKGGKSVETPKIPPEAIAWIERNKDFTSNVRLMALANTVAAELRSKGDRRVGDAFFDAVRSEVEKFVGTNPNRGGDGKGASGNGGGGRSNTSGGGKSYADLPAEAKAACDRQAARLVGPNRLHKSIESWRASYSKQYFGEES